MSLLTYLVSALARSRVLWVLLVTIAAFLMPYLSRFLNGLTQIVKAIVLGATGILSSWQNVLATLLVAAVMTSVGIRIGVRLTQEVAIEAFAERDTWILAHEQLLTQADEADRKNKETFDAAVQAGIKAELAARANADPRTSKRDKQIVNQVAQLGSGPAGAGARPDAGGVRKRAKASAAAKGANDPVGSWVRAVWAVFAKPVASRP